MHVVGELRQAGGVGGGPVDCGQAAEQQPVSGGGVRAVGAGRQAGDGGGGAGACGGRVREDRGAGSKAWWGWLWVGTDVADAGTRTTSNQPRVLWFGVRPLVFLCVVPGEWFIEPLTLMRMSYSSAGTGLADMAEPPERLTARVLVGRGFRKRVSSS